MKEQQQRSWVVVPMSRQNMKYCHKNSLVFEKIEKTSRNVVLISDNQGKWQNPARNTGSLGV